MRSLFGKWFRGSETRSKDDAKHRLKVLLVHDQVDLTPAQLDKMKDEIMEVIARYVEVDQSEAEFRITREDDGIALVSSVPVRRVHARAS